MNKRSLRALVALNLVLLVALGVVTLTGSNADAQVGGPLGQYTMIAGSVRSQQHEVIYIIDQRTSTVGALMYRGQTQKFEPLAGTVIWNDLKRVTAGNGN